MAAAAPYSEPAPRSQTSAQGGASRRARVDAEHYLPYARTIEREHPEELAALGMTAEGYAAAVGEPGLTIEESIAAGFMSAEEGRYVQGRATREDLIELGYAAAQIEVILEDQRARACASSG